MTSEEFAALLNEFTLSAESGDGARFAGHFTEDAIYHDYIYGPHKGRADIGHMMQELFHRDAADYRWEIGASAVRGKLVDDPVLQPNRARLDRDRVVDDRPDKL